MTSATTTTTTPRDQGVKEILEQAYRALVKAGNDSVRAAWRFGQTVDSFTDDWTMGELAELMDLSSGTLYRYARLYRAYQRPELAVAASRQLETYNIDLIWALQNELKPVEHGRPMTGRRYRYTCNTCHSHDVGRVELTEAEIAALEAGN
jgi:hypothetical protein